MQTIRFSKDYAGPLTSGIAYRKGDYETANGEALGIDSARLVARGYASRERLPAGVKAGPSTPKKKRRKTAEPTPTPDPDPDPSDAD